MRWGGGMGSVGPPSIVTELKSKKINSHFFSPFFSSNFLYYAFGERDAREQNKKGFVYGFAQAQNTFHFGCTVGLNWPSAALSQSASFIAHCMACVHVGRRRRGP